MPNRLAQERSPYLLQHASNPVDWYPWSDEAIERARKEDKPIFLSIGYSTCHWCHVMERESFEDNTIAALLNTGFVSIKVDREERPDLDRLYMSATVAMTGSGGWPMSLFLTPELKPFFAGTYFPPASGFGRPGFIDVLTAVRESWIEQRESIETAADGVVQYLRKKLVIINESQPIADNLSTLTFNQLEEVYDDTSGGFGSVPKFPRPVTLNFLLRYYYRTGERRALKMALHTLEKMSRGGIYDHLGGGFHRYSVDRHWRVPHFEKMLYDQAQLVNAYLDAYQITRDQLYAAVARDTLDYVLRVMTGPHGAFYSAQDADSPIAETPDEKGEGAFYVWSQNEVEALLGAETATILNDHYGIEKDGNAPVDPHGEFTGKNILFIKEPLSSLVLRFGKKENALKKIISESRQVLFAARNHRPHPFLDDKVITSWNGLMIGAFARASSILNETRYLEAAEQAAQFVINTLFESRRRRLLRRYRNNEAGLDAHLEDYASFVLGLLDLYEASFDPVWIDHAVNLTELQIDLFYDRNDGGFFDTSGEDPSLFIRSKDDHDGAIPAGNAVAAYNLFRLAAMTENKEWYETAKQTVSTFAERLNRDPSSIPQMMIANDYTSAKSVQIVIAGLPDQPDTRKMLREVHRRFLPYQTLFLADESSRQERLAVYLPFLRDITRIDGKATAYVCEDYVCRRPTTKVDEFGAQLDRISSNT